MPSSKPEYLARVVWSKKINGKEQLYPDTIVGTDSHTTMINALGVLGWGVCELKQKQLCSANLFLCCFLK